MGFVIQWLVCLIAFVAGSALAYGIALLVKPKRRNSEEAVPETAPEPEPDPEPEPPVAEPQPAQQESSEIGATG